MMPYISFLRNKLSLALCTFILIGCGPKVSLNLAKTYAAFDPAHDVVILDLMHLAPAKGVLLGKMKIGDSGFSTNCKWDVVMERAKTEARKAGANVVKITEHIPPGSGSTCDRIMTELYRVDDPQEFTALLTRKIPLVDSTWKYAMLYIYRPSGPGMLIGYNLHLGDSVICRVKNSSTFVHKIIHTGRDTLWAKTEAKISVPFEIEHGREYFLRCGVEMGALVGRPALRLMHPAEGKKEYQIIKGPDKE